MPDVPWFEAGRGMKNARAGEVGVLGSELRKSSRFWSKRLVECQQRRDINYLYLSRYTMPICRVEYSHGRLLNNVL